MLNKPKGVVSATTDNLDKTGVELLRKEKYWEELFPVGRLDKDTEGLLLLTNEGGLAHDLLSPRHHVDKIYYARVAGKLTEEEVRGAAFNYAPYEEMVAKYDPAKLTDGFNTVDGEEIFYISNPALGLWVCDD